MAREAVKRCRHCSPPFCQTAADCIFCWTDPDEGNAQALHYVERLPVLLLQGARQREGQIAHWTAGELARRLQHCQPLREKLQAPAWLPVRMREGSRRRKASEVAAVWALVLDLDQDVRSIEHLWRSVRQLQCEAIAHTTWSHSEAHPKARVVLPLREECPAEQWQAVWRAAQRWALTWGASMDQACKDPSRIYFLPAAPRERLGAFRARMWTGERICWRRLLCEHPEPKQRKRIARPGKTSAGLQRRHAVREEKRSAGYAAAALRGVLADLSAVTQGGRNQALFRASCRLGRLLAQHSSLERSAVEAELIAVAAGIGLAEQEAARTARRGIETGMQEVSNQ